MSTATEQAIEAIYDSLTKDNEDLDQYIKELKAALLSEKKKEAVFDSSRLAQNNRQGRKRMQSYFKKNGVKVVFRAEE